VFHRSIHRRHSLHLTSLPCFATNINGTSHPNDSLSREFSTDYQKMLSSQVDPDHVFKTTGTPFSTTIVVVSVNLGSLAFFSRSKLANGHRGLRLLHLFVSFNHRLDRIDKQKRASRKPVSPCRCLVPVIGFVTSALLLIISLSTIFMPHPTA